MECRTACAVCQGTYHIQNNLPCQDAVGERQWESHAAVALADGAGSRPFSQVGAQTVVRTVLDLLESVEPPELNTPDEFAEKIVSLCLAALAQNPYTVDGQASTLLFCAVDTNGIYLCGHLGDGYIFHASGEMIRILSSPENGETRNETVFVTSSNAAKHLRLQRGILQKGDAIILCSDGSSEVLYSQDNDQFAPALAKMAEWIKEYKSDEVSQALEYNMNHVFRNGSVDDMSIAVISCL